ncbi:MAG: hypothetical protein IJX81_04635 [Clostridia bacterium]|nr:hypothetical protein [Clostridia bacterium]
MRKEIRRSISLLCTAAAFTVLAVSCGGQPTETSEKPSITIMNGFEHFDRDVQQIRVFNRFGRLEVNMDEKYVRSGNSSLHVQPFGGRIAASTSNPYFVIPTTSVRFQEYAYNNFKDVETLCFWAYNAEAEPLNVGVSFQAGDIGVVGGRPSADNVQRTAVEYYSLKSGWNYVEYEIRSAYLAMHGVTVENVKGIALEFDYVWSNDFADAPDVYIDDVSLRYAEKKKMDAVAFDGEKKTSDTGVESWSVCDFEKPSQNWYFWTRMAVTPPAAQPVVKQVFAGDYGTLAQEGGQALLIGAKHGGKQKGAYIGVFLYADALKAAMAAVGEDLKNNPQNYAFKFDAYNASEVTTGFSVAFVGTATGANFTIEPHTWKTYTSLNFAELNARSDDVNNPYTQNVGDVRFAFSDYSASGNYADRPVLIDNVRIEKIA